ncbi:MAG TPA: tetratricopeptide repeat protein [Bryobacteraceae bacterium]|nr:tetratricopeptide repeat protein [Bryobacteraceae bacterium]
MDRITRKELKQDRFAQEVGHTVEFLGEHRRQAIRIGIIAVAIILLVVGVLAWRRYQQTNRAVALSAAFEIHNGSVGANPYSFRTFNTAEEKRKAELQAFGDLAAKYPGTSEGVIAEYYLGVLAADQGNLGEAEKHFKVVVDEGDNNYASLARLTLADLYQAQNKPAEAESLLRKVVDKPSDFVSKEQAQIALARVLMKTKPDEARKLLEPLRTERSAVSRAAITLLGDLSNQR